MIRTPRFIKAVAKGRKKYLLPLSDVHIGAPTADLEKAKGMIDWAVENDAWILLLGDICEVATKGSVGAGAYEQTMDPQEQQDYAVELLRPAAEKGLILGAVIGNHEWRAKKESGVDITKNICDILRFPYLGYSIFIDIRVGKQRYTVFGTHGGGGSTTLVGKIGKIKKLSEGRNADLFLMGHVHELWTGSDVVLNLNRKRKILEENKRYYLLTGAYLKYAGSYGEMISYPPSKTGSARVRFSGTNHKDIHISI